MKIIISHDIDHLSVKEHYHDLIIPKFIGLSSIELLKGNISLKTYIKRLGGLFRENAWNNLRELLEFDREHNVNSTFFVAVANDLGISYSLNEAEKAIHLIKKRGFDLGVHGIEYKNIDGISDEYNTFRRISGLKKFGIRMHYLRKNERTLDFLDKAGYVYDTTEFSEDLKQPYFIGNLLEIPLHIMDGYLFLPKYMGLSLERAINLTKNLLERAKKENKLVNILFHQRYFSDEFPRYKGWYEWLIKYATENEFEFLTYKEIARERVD